MTNPGVVTYTQHLDNDEAIQAYLDACVEESDGDPTLSTIAKVASALGLTLTLQPKSTSTY
ncbi:hypothetical protein EGC76_04340 [Pseudidiomarina gelatinasegens]|uniref:Addiction module antidote protein n=1 Tax=Pseudidiomarina gelatinasegens TaxID=2487740 RepID=A0A451GEJ3_9GAMM|nr:hypothetical protein EGC76_04340 [Pseudidiomarina gelatinasegens]